MLDVFADADERPRVVKLAVTQLPGSGKGAELLHECGIDADAIVTAASAWPSSARRSDARRRRRRRLTDESDRAGSPGRVRRWQLGARPSRGMRVDHVCADGGCCGVVLAADDVVGAGHLRPADARHRLT